VRRELSKPARRTGNAATTPRALLRARKGNAKPECYSEPSWVLGTRLQHDAARSLSREVDWAHDRADPASVRAQARGAYEGFAGFGRTDSCAWRP
jgi:hypothetical protein